MTNLQQTTEEIWKDIPGFENIYQASTMGRIRSLDRRVPKWNGLANCNTFYKGKILKPFRQRDGYVLIDLCDKTFIVQRVIYRTFKGEIPKGWYAIRHRNNKKDDNRLCNLILGTYSENSQDAVNDNLYIHGRTGLHGSKNPQSKAVRQIDSNGNVISVFESCVNAANKLKLSQGAISNVCRGRAKTSGGFKWQYV